MGEPARVTPINPAFVIETGVPRSSKGSRGQHAGPITAALRNLLAAPLGASVFIPAKRARDIGPYVTSADSTVKGWAESRSVEGGVRVWKIAEPKPRT
jgi:hypothetical protein